MCCESMTITTILPATIVHIFSILVCKRMTFKQKGPGSNLPQQKCDAAEGAFAAFASHSMPSGGRVPYKKAANSCRHQMKTVPLLSLPRYLTFSSELGNRLHSLCCCRRQLGQWYTRLFLVQTRETTLLCLGLEAHCCPHCPTWTNIYELPG